MDEGPDGAKGMKTLCRIKHIGVGKSEEAEQNLEYRKKSEGRSDWSGRSEGIGTEWSERSEYKLRGYDSTSPLRPDP